MGIIGAVVCYAFVTIVKVKLGYDDSLDVFGIHGVGGTVGAVLTGLFATEGLSLTGIPGGGQPFEPRVIGESLDHGATELHRAGPAQAFGRLGIEVPQQEREGLAGGARVDARRCTGELG